MLKDFKLIDKKPVKTQVAKQVLRYTDSQAEAGSNAKHAYGLKVSAAI